MKHFIITLLFIASHFAFYACGQAPARNANDYVRPYPETFQYGTNMGYYNSNWPDESLAGIAHAAGAHSIRPTLPERFLAQYGYNVRVAAFDKYVNTLEMREITCFVEGPSVAHQDMTIYPGCTGSSKLFAHMYEPIWNADGTVNQNNYYAYYLYRLLDIYGDKVRFWEVVNEPDFTYSGNIDAWLTRAPTPNELTNVQAPIYHYVRMLRISYEVIKRFRPDAYITTGGVGYPQFVDALLRYTDNPVDGSATAQYPNTAGAYIDALSFHSYPSYSLHYWDNARNGFRYTRTSDYAANKVMQDKQAMVDVLNRYGYDGVTHPAKILLMSETNVSRRTSDDRTGSDELQRNFGIKALVLAQKNNIRQLYYYALGESVNAPPAWQTVSGSDELALMGLYENLNRDAPGAQRTTQLGQAFATTSALLYGATYDVARTAALALPSGIEGAAFSRNGTYSYVLWAKALVDNSETAAATYSFPAAWNLGSVQRYEWNYSTTSTKTTQSSQGITLTATPSFFGELPGVGGSNPGTTTPAVTGCAGTGSLTREQWDNLGGAGVGSVPVASAPSSSAPLTAFEQITNGATNYGARIRGYLCPPQSGAYTFFVVGDDQAELWLSSDDNPANKVRIASCVGWTSSPHDWLRMASQRSAPVQLVAGRRYYVEALHKQGWGPGYVSVAWRLPNGILQEPLPGSALIPFAATTTTPAATSCAGTGSLTREQWDNVSGPGVSSVPVASAPSSSAPLSAFEQTTNLAYNYGARLRGYLCPPQSGAYTFFVVGDDQAELWLSSDDNPANKVRIASCVGWTSSPHDWLRMASQRSAPVQLVAGRRYYVEALHKQGWGPGYVSVAWRLPNGTLQEPLPGSALIPFAATTGGRTALPMASPQTGGAGQRTELGVFPNPFHKQATVQFTATQSGPIKLELYDLKGQRVQQLFEGNVIAGALCSYPLAAATLSTGLYFVRLTTAHEVVTQKVAYTTE